MNRIRSPFPWRWLPHLALSSVPTITMLAAQSAQGTYTNFETPQTHPLEVVTIGGSEFVLVCNTPNDSLEIWKATNAAPTFVARVGVGLGPGTVRWNAALDRAFVCNFDGDSVSIVEIQPSGSSVSARLISTTPVGDEPADIAFNASSTLAAITLSTSSRVQFVQPDMTPTVSERLDVAYTASNGLYLNPPPPPFLLAVKMPRAVQWTTNDRLFVLNFMGGQMLPNTNEFIDVDLWRKDAPTSPGSTPNYLGQLGTTNHAFALNAGGTRMFVVGTRAQNRIADGVTKVRDLLTGFVQSWLTVIDIPGSGNMTIRPESGAGISGPGGFPDFPSINLNRNYSVGGSPAQEVASQLGISQPTDIDLFESGTSVTRIAIAGFHTDNIALLTPLPNGSATPGGYTISRKTLVPASTYGMVGPRGVAFNANGTRLYVNGRFDNTLRVIDTSTPTLTETIVNLQGQDPTPADVRVGRQFLYSTRFSRSVNSPAPIKSGFVSCASCHVDGRTDGLSWNLSDPAGPGPAIPPMLIENPMPLFTAFPNPKNRMITQTLQGLVNYLTNESYQFLATNAPYHWRGDRNDFTAFNEAFVNLQRMPNVGNDGDPRGLSSEDMVTYRRFVNTIRHPPNPEQSLERICTGSLSNPNNASISGSGSLLGRAIFHNFNIDFGNASCVTCHSLPDGSTNTITLEAGNATASTQPIESGALRNLGAREAMIHSSTTPITPTATPTHMLDFPGTARVANDGLTHAGIVEIATGTPVVNEDMSINRFTSNISFFPFMPAIAGSWPPPSFAGAVTQMGALIQFVRELDSGEAPAAGVAHTVTNVSTVDAPVFDLLEEQVNQGNIGLGVRSQDGAGVIRGFWFDPLNGGVYRDAAAPLGTTFTRVDLLAMFAGAGTGRTMVLQGTPPGTERRWASPTGNATAIVGSAAPSAVQLEPMAPSTFFEGITDLNQAPAGGQPGTTGWAIQTLRATVGGSFGLSATVRHEPPRRFRVSGDNIRPGARLFLFMQNYTPSSGVFWQVPGMEMALVPTKFTEGNRPIWETVVEIDEQQTLALLNGGPFDPRVRAILDAGANSPPTLPPAQLTNLYAVIVVNEDGTASSLTPTPVPLFVQDDRL